jgi:hypothetical protein
MILLTSGATPVFFLTFFLDKKSKQKNQGKMNGSARFARPAPHHQSVFFKTLL